MLARSSMLRPENWILSEVVARFALSWSGYALFVVGLMTKVFSFLLWSVILDFGGGCEFVVVPVFVVMAVLSDFSG